MSWHPWSPGHPFYEGNMRSLEGYSPPRERTDLERAIVEVRIMIHKLWEEVFSDVRTWALDTNGAHVPEEWWDFMLYPIRERDPGGRIWWMYVSRDNPNFHNELLNCLVNNPKLFKRAKGLIEVEKGLSEYSSLVEVFMVLQQIHDLQRKPSKR